jgi:hypothetical protein
MPVFFAGFIKADGTIKYGGGFTVSKVGGAYRITIATSRTLILVATPVTGAGQQRSTRISQIQQDTGSGTVSIDVDIRDPANTLVIGDFTFIALEVSGP